MLLLHEEEPEGETQKEGAALVHTLGERYHTSHGELGRQKRDPGTRLLKVTWIVRNLVLQTPMRKSTSLVDQ